MRDFEFYMPFDHAINPFVKEARQHSREWLSGFGVTKSTKQSDAVDAAGLSVYMSRCWPIAAYEDILLGSDFGNWILVYDDLFDHVRGDAPWKTAIELAAKHVDIVESRSAHRVPEEPPIVSSFRDFWVRESTPMSPSFRARAARHWAEYLTGCAEEVGVRQGTRQGPTDIDSYFAIRRRTIALEVCFDLSERVNRYELPPRLAEDPRLMAMRTCASDVIILINDLFSTRKEDASGDLFNIVLLLERLHGYSREAALEETVRRQHDRVKEYLHLRSLLLEGLPPEERDAAQRHFFDMEHWMSGSLDWHIFDAIDRYK